ncbi:hypothetical protein GGR57DRAFT_466084 [Xylariaceae sp. FL1272]|nr:hypothetical protein GGR57DRAFT_466084 [Xylariaceae sp. FL1272]
MAKPYPAAVAAFPPRSGAISLDSIAHEKKWGLFHDLRDFFRKWFRFDILQVVVAAVLFKSAIPKLFAWEAFKSELRKHILPIFSSRVSISGQDKLNEHVLHWIIKNKKFRSRKLAAQCTAYWGVTSVYKTIKLEGMKEEDAAKETIYYVCCTIQERRKR